MFDDREKMRSLDSWFTKCAAALPAKVPREIAHAARPTVPTLRPRSQVRSANTQRHQFGPAATVHELHEEQQTMLRRAQQRHEDEKGIRHRMSVAACAAATPDGCGVVRVVRCFGTLQPVGAMGMASAVYVWPPRRRHHDRVARGRVPRETKTRYTARVANFFVSLSQRETLSPASPRVRASASYLLLEFVLPRSPRPPRTVRSAGAFRQIIDFMRDESTRSS